MGIYERVIFNFSPAGVFLALGTINMSLILIEALSTPNGRNVELSLIHNNRVYKRKQVLSHTLLVTTILLCWPFNIPALECCCVKSDRCTFNYCGHLIQGELSKTASDVWIGILSHHNNRGQSTLGSRFTMAGVTYDLINKCVDGDRA